MVKVLFVCMGNICRSPTAEGVFAYKVKEAGLEDVIAIDSAGTHAYHVGEPPDPRAQKAASARGIDIGYITARRAQSDDFAEFDYVLAMDLENLDNLRLISSEDSRATLRLFLDYASFSDVEEVPDPYYGGALGFERVLDLIEDASDGLLKVIRKEHLIT